MTEPHSTRQASPAPHAAAEPLFDRFVPGFTDDPYPQYAAVRTAAPVYLRRINLRGPARLPVSMS
jgi:hypothetical protein